MKNSVRRWRTAFAVYLSLLLVGVGAVLAFQVRPKTSRFDVLVIEDQTESLDVSTAPVASLASSERLRGAWDGFKAAHGSNWSIYLDRRSGAPMLVEGQGIPWQIAKGATADTIAPSLRTFMAANRALFLADESELVLDHNS